MAHIEDVPCEAEFQISLIFTIRTFLQFHQMSALRVPLIYIYIYIYTHTHMHRALYSGADKSLARPGRKQATATEDFDVHISYL